MRHNFHCFAVNSNTPSFSTHIKFISLAPRQVLERLEEEQGELSSQIEYLSGQIQERQEVMVSNNASGFAYLHGQSCIFRDCARRFGALKTMSLVST